MISFTEGKSRVEFKELTVRICLLRANSSAMKFTLIVKVFTGENNKYHQRDGVWFTS